MPFFSGVATAKLPLLQYVTSHHVSGSKLVKFGELHTKEVMKMGKGLVSGKCSSRKGGSERDNQVKMIKKIIM